MARLIFANQLRGLAAMSVLASHLVGVYWGAPEIVGAATATPPQTGPIPPIFSMFAQPWLHFGPLGVAVFFLISGLVIPMSLTTHSRGTFLLARLLRIFPTYVLGLLLCALVVGLSAAWWHLPVPFTRPALVINGLLLFDLMGRPSVDLVNWTLVTELKFYLLMMLAAPLIRRGDLRALFAISLAALAYNIAWRNHYFGWLQDRFPAQFGMASLESICVVYMLIGVVFSYHVRGQISGQAALLAGAAISGLFLACWHVSMPVALFPNITVDYAYGLALFGGAYLLRDRFQPIWPLDALAAVSFPLYAIHSLLGYSLLKLFTLTAGIAYLAALVLSFGVVLLSASVLHFTVERWSIAAGRRLAPRPVL